MSFASFRGNMNSVVHDSHTSGAVPRCFGGVLGTAVPSEEVKYEECEKMSLDSEEGAIIGKATMPWVSDWPVSIRASGCNGSDGFSCSGAN